LEARTLRAEEKAMGWRAAAGIAAVLALAGCQQTVKPTQEAEGQYFVLRTPSGIADARVTAREISGPNVSLTRYGDSVRGHAFGHTVDFFWSDGDLKGNLGGAPIDLKVDQEGDTLEIYGLYAGRQGTLVIKPGVIKGTIGACSYDFKAGSGGEYVGQVACGGIPENATLAIPPILTTFSAPEIAGYLVLFLGR
jgi:hypothetical protein